MAEVKAGDSVRISSDGLVYDTVITNAKTGEPIPGVVSAKWTLNATEGPRHATIELTLVCPQIDVCGKVTKLTEVCPRCGHETPRGVLP